MYPNSSLSSSALLSFVGASVAKLQKSYDWLFEFLFRLCHYYESCRACTMRNVCIVRSVGASRTWLIDEMLAGLFDWGFVGCVESILSRQSWPGLQGIWWHWYGAKDTLSVRAVLQSYELVAVGIISERLFDIRNLFLNMVGVNFLRGMRWTGGDRGHYFLNLVEWKGVRRSVFLAGGCGGFGSATLEACRLWYGGMGTWWLYFEGVVDVQPPLAQLSHPPATSVWVEEGYCEFIGRFGGLVGLKWVGAVG
ncbi:hypothetical protein Tco_0832152 [Tanacetum coccineum]